MIFLDRLLHPGIREHRSMSAPIRSSPDNLIGTALRVLYGMRYDQGRGRYSRSSLMIWLLSGVQRARTRIPGRIGR